MSKEKRKSKIAAQAEKMAADLAAIRRAMRQPLEAEVAGSELTVPQKAVMQAVVRQPGMILRDLSGAVSLAHSTVSGIVDRLEGRGLIERRPDEKDGRTARIYPAQQASEFMSKRMPEMAQGPLQAALEKASKDERQEIGEALERLRKLLETK